MDTANDPSVHSFGAMHARLMARASGDPDFRKLLVANPKGAVRQEFGIAVPDSIELVVHESNLSTIHLSVPPAFDELSEEQLEGVSAGACACH